METGLGVRVSDYYYSRVFQARKLGLERSGLGGQTAQLL